jgi:hypothetical protein
MGLLNSLIGPATELAGKFIQDKDKAAELAHELATMSEKIASEQALAQLEVNKAEAASGSLFKGGVAPEYRMDMWVSIILVVYLAAFSCVLLVSLWR